MPSLSGVISAIKSWRVFSCEGDTVWPTFGVTAGQQKIQMYRYAARCCCLNFPVSCLLCALVLLMRRAFLAPRLLLSASLFSHCASSRAGQWFSSKWTVAGICCFLLEISARVQRSQCIFRSGRGLSRSGQKRRGPKTTCWLDGCLWGQTTQWDGEENKHLHLAVEEYEVHTERHKKRLECLTLTIRDL